MKGERLLKEGREEKEKRSKIEKLIYNIL